MRLPWLLHKPYLLLDLIPCCSGGKCVRVVQTYVWVCNMWYGQLWIMCVHCTVFYMPVCVCVRARHVKKKQGLSLLWFFLYDFTLFVYVCALEWKEKCYICQTLKPVCFSSDLISPQSSCLGRLYLYIFVSNA